MKVLTVVWCALVRCVRYLLLGAGLTVMSTFVSEPDDLENNNPPPAAAGAIDAVQLEASKENIQPLRRGRNAQRLLHALQVQNDAESLAAERQQKEDAIKSYTGTDPLAPWYVHREPSAVWRLLLHEMGGADVMM